MNATIAFALNRAAAETIAEHLRTCDADFFPALSTRLDIKSYAEKIAAHAARLEAWSGETLVGLAAIYCNERAAATAFLTSLSVLPAWRGHGLAADLLARGIAQSRAAGMKKISLEVAPANSAAIAVYKKAGFLPGKASGEFLTMHLNLHAPP